jgi:putative hydrolase of the HAD superfamily
MQIEAVLFDLFDTLVLLQKEEAYYIPSLRKLHESLVENGINLSFDDFRRVYFEVRDKLYSETKENFEEPHFNVRVSRVLQEFGYNLSASSPVVAKATEAFSDELTQYISLDDEAIDVLRKLQEKYKLGLISNFAIPEMAWKLLDRFGLREYFDVILVSGDINKRKPSPEIFAKALDTLRVDASRAVFVGDMIKLDVEGAKNAGMKSVLIERGSSKEFKDVKPDKIITSLRQLSSTLESFISGQ